jgi:glutamate synthase (NADPH/NADH) small chain
MAAADLLNKAGHSVTIFEKDEHAGGLLRFGILILNSPRQLSTGG